MKYVILAMDDKRIIHLSDDLGYQSNGNYLINNGTIAIPPSICEMVMVDSVPDNVEPEKYCYIDNTFVENPNWSEPVEEEYLTPDEVISILTGEGT